MNHLRRLALEVKGYNSVLKDNFLKSSDPWNEPLKKFYFGETYEGTGKTTGYIINKKNSPVFCVENINSKGFQLTNGWHIIGPVILFPHKIFSWKVKSVNDINEESLALFSVLQPPVECLFIGWGEHKSASVENVKNIIRICKEMKINFELSDTDSAVAGYNFCSLDNRYIAAAIIPPGKVTYHRQMQLKCSQVPDVVVKENTAGSLK